MVCYQCDKNNQTYHVGYYKCRIECTNSDTTIFYLSAEKEYRFFQQDSATTYAAKNSVLFIRVHNIFEDQNHILPDICNSMFYSF